MSASEALKKPYFNELAPIEDLLAIPDGVAIFDAGLGLMLQRDPGRLGNNCCRCPQCTMRTQVRRNKSVRFETRGAYEVKRSWSKEPEKNKGIIEEKALGYEYPEYAKEYYHEFAYKYESGNFHLKRNESTKLKEEQSGKKCKGFKSAIKRRQSMLT